MSIARGGCTEKPPTAERQQRVYHQRKGVGTEDEDEPGPRIGHREVRVEWRFEVVDGGVQLGSPAREAPGSSYNDGIAALTRPCKNGRHESASRPPPPPYGCMT
jgi:hypothetical protein